MITMYGDVGTNAVLLTAGVWYSPNGCVRASSRVSVMRTGCLSPVGEQHEV